MMMVLVVVVLVTVTLASVYQHTRRNCQIYKTIATGNRSDLVYITISKDRIITRFTANPSMEGQSCSTNAAMVKMCERASTGGGMVPFRARDSGPCGRVLSYMFFVEANRDGGVSGQGLRLESEFP